MTMVTVNNEARPGALISAREALKAPEPKFTWRASCKW